MALHTELEIYPVATEWLDVATELTRNIPRSYKRKFTDIIVDWAVEMAVLIIEANIARDKAPVIDRILMFQRKTDLLVRLFNDKHWISPKQFATAIALVVSIGKQAQKWKGSSRLPQSGYGPAARAQETGCAAAPTEHRDAHKGNRRQRPAGPAQSPG